MSEKNAFKKDPLFFCFSKSCFHGLSDAFCVLAVTVVLYFSIARYSSLSGSQVHNISTEENAEGSSCSLRLSLNKAFTKCQK